MLTILNNSDLTTLTYAIQSTHKQIENNSWWTTLFNQSIKTSIDLQPQEQGWLLTHVQTKHGDNKIKINKGTK